MTYNNTVTLIGNLGSEAKIVEGENKKFVSVSLATADSYKDKDENWVQKDSIWHDLISFSPSVIERLKSLKKGTRVKVTGSINYRPFQAQIEDGSFVSKKQASIIIGKVELAPLVKKSS